MSRLIVGPFNRVEGDLEVKLDLGGDSVRKAWVVSPLYRGFEQILHGKPPTDALIYAPRICGICSVSQSIAAAHALADAQHLRAPPNGRFAANLIHAAENVADHLTHFYMFFMPDFARDAYGGEPWHLEAVGRFKAISGSAAHEVLPARAQFMHLMGILAGKWPHTLGIQAGGSTRAVTGHELARLSGILAAFRQFLQRTLFGDELERIAEISSAEELDAWAGERPGKTCDFRHFLHLSGALELHRLGRAADNFLSYGAYQDQDGYLFRRGLFSGGKPGKFDAGGITEDLSHAWYLGSDGPQLPFEGRTEPDGDQRGGYTWCKAPRLDGRVMETGALARQVIDAHPLILDLVASGGGNVHSRVVARLLEIARVVMAMEDWVRRIEPGEPFICHGEMPDSTSGMGLTEAARGSLGHWLKVERGRIANYQIIAPTTWNFSPRDETGRAGALEQALVGAAVRPGETEPVSVQHIVRSFDPCLVCTVH